MSRRSIFSVVFFSGSSRLGRYSPDEPVIRFRIGFFKKEVRLTLEVLYDLGFCFRHVITVTVAAVHVKGAVCCHGLRKSAVVVAFGLVITFVFPDCRVMSFVFAFLWVSPELLIQVLDPFLGFAPDLLGVHLQQFTGQVYAAILIFQRGLSGRSSFLKGFFCPFWKVGGAIKTIRLFSARQRSIL